MSTRSPIGKVLVALATRVVAGATMFLLVLAMLVVSLVPLVLGVLRAEPAAASANCVAVVVDFRELGGAVQTGCAQGDPATGLQALSSAGFGYTPRPRDGLICQIDARPACTATTSTTYWSYWYRAPGSSHWVYASEGAGTHTPKPGSTEAWVWQNGGKTPPPSIRADVICPQLAATPSSTPAPTHTLPTSTASIKPSTQRSHQPTRTATTDPTGSTQRPRSKTSTPNDPPASSATSSPASSSPSPLSATQAPPSDGSTAAPAAGPAGPADQSGSGALGGGAGAALGGVVILGIGAAAVIRARRGRSS